MKSFGNFKKRFGTSCLSPEKNFWRPELCLPLKRSEADVANLTESRSSRWVSFRPFTFVPIHCTNCTWQARSCLPAASTTTKESTLRTVRLSSEKSSFAGQAMDPNLDWGFSRTKSLRQSRSFCRLSFDFAGFTESLRQKFGRSLPARVFACCKRLSAGVYPVFPTQRQNKLSFLLLFFSFLSFFLKEASARFSKRASRDSASMLYARTWTRVGLCPDSNHERCTVTLRRCVSDHVQSTSGQRSIDLPAPAGTVELPHGRARVKADLSKLKSRRRSVTACRSIMQKGFFAGVERSGLSQGFENAGLFRE